MNMRQLQHMVALVEHRNFHRAAEAVGITQSALTQSIQKLEDEYGVTLFDRNKRDVIPTTYGHVVADSAREMLSQLQGMKSEVGRMKNLESGRLVIGCDTLIAEGLLGPTFAGLMIDYSHLRFSVRVDAWEEMLKDLLAARIDIYVGPRPLAADSRMRLQTLDLPPLVLACNPDHPLLDREEIRLLDVFEFPLVGPRPPSWYKTWLIEQVGSATNVEGKDLSTYFLDCDDGGTIKWLIRHTDALTGMYAPLIVDELERGELRTIRLEPLDFALPIAVARLSDRSLPPAAEIFTTMLTDEIDRQWATHRLKVARGLYQSRVIAPR